jgi:biopolymer transport protein ExbB/TolQ
MNFNDLAEMWGNCTYAFLTLNFLWGLFCAIMVWRRLVQLRFKTEEEQGQFQSDLETTMASGDFNGAVQVCENDPRALPQLALLAVSNRKMPTVKLRQLVADHFQRDVLADLENRVNWVVTVIRAGPLLGLYGTVLGMMAAFGRIGTGQEVKPEEIANEISIALICTAMGLTTAIPFTYVVSALNNRVRKLQELVSMGLSRLLDHLKALVP